jgi:short-subunit dehydrogenase
LVTGGSKGIGLALAREFARNGYDLLLVARKKEALKKAATEIEDASGVAVRTYAIDLAGPDAPEELFHYVQEAGIHVDALINNAGLGAHGAFAQSDRSRTNAMLDLNVVSLTSLTHLFLEPMLARGEGRIINVASVVAYFSGGPQWAAYVASKSYVLSFSRGLAAELRGTGVTVTALAPGSTATDFVADAGVGSTRVYRWLPKVSVERIARTASSTRSWRFLASYTHGPLPLPCSRCCRGEGPGCRARCRQDSYDLRRRKALSQPPIAGL